MSLRSKFHNLRLTRFLEELDNNNLCWIVKRLSGNDTGLSGGHQAGLYLPRAFFEAALPEICTTEVHNPDSFINECYFPAQGDSIINLRAIYYNSKFFPEKGLKKKYDEFRLTRWGGSSSPVQDVENTGSICVFAIGREHGKAEAVSWVSTGLDEDLIIENWLGSEVEPGRMFMRAGTSKPESGLVIPEEWFVNFPSGRQIFDFVLKRLPYDSWSKSVDELLLRRRSFEFEAFEVIENAEVFPQIQKGFTSVKEFIAFAHSVSNRRKSRTGTSLELNLASIFREKEVFFEPQVVTENMKKPDFVFPSGKAYHDSAFPSMKLHMMASKTCCKDRWRQVINEADRIETKHLFTLQEGVSVNQINEMEEHKVQLVIPEPHMSSFPKDKRCSLMTLDSFVGYVKQEQKVISNLSQWVVC